MKRSALLPLAIILLAVIPPQLPAQEQDNSNTLLWEISGNGLAEPSYLYGTMHVYDRRAFDFSDSVLLKFQQCSAFAAELSFDEALADLIRYYEEKQRTATTSPIHVMPAVTASSARQPDDSSTQTVTTFTSVEKAPVSVTVPKDNAISLATPDSDSISVAALEDDAISLAASDADEISPPLPDGESNGDAISFAAPDNDSELAQPSARARRRTIPDMFFDKYDSWEPGDNPVVVDAYLYRLAKKENKKIIGLETADEQLRALDYSNPGESWSFYISNAKRLRRLSEEDIAETMIRQYRKGEVRKLHDFMQQNLPPTLYRRMIVERNRTMVERAAEHIRQQPTFIAVGAGHLAGDEGMIQLLRGRGFTVRPVKVVRSGLARQYREPDRKLAWRPFSSPEGAYAMELPAEPIRSSRLAALQDNAGEDADSSLMFWSDISTGITYFAGYYDMAYEVEFPVDETGMIQMPFILQFEESSVSRLPALVTREGLQGCEVTLVGEDKRISRTRYIPRGNRLYFLQAEVVPELEMSGDIERFFNSFRKLNFAGTKTWAYTSQEGRFTVTVPDAPSTFVDTLSYPSSHIRRNFTGIDRNSGSPFSVRVITFSDYFQAVNEDSLFSDYLELYGSDSLASMTTINVQGSPARDLLFINPRTGFTRRMRYILRGNDLYILRASAQADIASSKQFTEFFDGFSMNGKIPGVDIYSDKSGKILADLRSDDPYIRVQASRALGVAPISTEHIPALHALLTSSLRGKDSSYDESRRAVLMKLSSMEDTSATAMIRELYPTLPKESDDVRLTALFTLSDIGTEESIRLFKELLLANPPSRTDDGSDPFGELYSNIEQSRFLYPEILTLLKREGYQSEVLWLTLKALEDSIISPAILAPYASLITDSLREMSRRRASALLDDEEENFYAEAYNIHVLVGCARFLPGSAELKSVFEGLARDPDNALAYCAILGLVRQGVTVRKSMIDKLADDPELRVRLYTELGQAGRPDLFPAAYRNQQSIAEALLVNWLVADYEYAPSDVQLLGEREVEVDGVRGRAFLFKYAYDDGDSWYAAISGLQPLNREELALTADVVGSNYKEVGSQSMEQHFAELLKPVEQP